MEAGRLEQRHDGFARRRRGLRFDLLGTGAGVDGGQRTRISFTVMDLGLLRLLTLPK